jgi:Protein of unknown function (DUF3662)/FHA domain
MGIIRNFEQRLEKAFEGTFSRIFKVGVHPIEIAKRVSREAEAGKRVTPGEVLMPNLYEIFLSPVDCERLSGYQAPLTAELETMVFEIARKNGYAMLTRPTFIMQSDHSLKEGQFAVEARITSSLPPDAAPPRVDQPQQAKPRTVTLSITGGLSEGTTRILESPETQLGRAQDNGVILDDQKVSRHHAVIRQEAGRFVIADLESTNGTFVGERRTQERILTDGDVIRLGDTTLLFSLA